MPLETLHSLAELEPKLSQFSRIYIEIFGTECKEGALNTSGQTIDLPTYLNHLALHDPNAPSQPELLLDWYFNLDANFRNSLYQDTAAYTGYTPLYTPEQVTNRFVQDLTPSEMRSPIISTYTNLEGQVVGFATGVVCHAPSAFTELCATAPYLNPEAIVTAQEQMDTSPISYPYLFQLEAALLPEYRQDQSQPWLRMHHNVQDLATQHSCQQAVLYTFPQGNYYRSLEKFGLIIDQAPAQAPDPNLAFVIIDLIKSHQQLSEKLGLN